MTGIIKLELGGQERTLRFNNFASIEIAKVLYKDELAKPDPEEIINKILELNAKNHYLLIKVLVYAGIIGNDYIVGFDQTVTQEEVGEWISTIEPKSLALVWTGFLDAFGMNIPAKEEEPEKAGTIKKKSRTLRN